MRLNRVKYFVATAFLFGICVNATSMIDSLRIDSLQRAVLTQSGRDQYSTTLELIYELVDVDNHKALEYAVAAAEMSLLIGDSVEIVRSKRIEGQLLRRSGLNRDAIEKFHEALLLAEKYHNNNEEMSVCNALGLAYVFAARYDSALRYYFRALRMRTDRNMLEEASIVLGNIGLLYYKIGEYDESIRFSEQSIEMSARTEHRTQAKWPMINVALCRIKKGELSEAERLLKEWLGKFATETASHELMSWQLTWGYMLFNQSKRDEAEGYYEKALQIANSINDGYYKVELNTCIAACLLGKRSERHRLDSLLDWCEMAAIEGGYDTSLESVYLRRIELNERLGNFEQLSKVQAKLLGLRQRVMNENVLHRVSVARVEFQERENELLIEKQNEAINLGKTAMSKQRWLTIACAVLALVFAGFLLLLYHFFRQQKSISRLLNTKVAERTRKLKASEEQLIRALGEQRAVMELISTKVRSSVASFRGLWQIGAAQSNRWKAVVTQFEQTADDLLQVSSIVDKSSALRSEEDCGLLNDRIPEITQRSIL